MHRLGLYWHLFERSQNFWDAWVCYKLQLMWSSLWEILQCSRNGSISLAKKNRRQQPPLKPKLGNPKKNPALKKALRILVPTEKLLSKSFSRRSEFQELTDLGSRPLVAVIYHLSSTDQHGSSFFTNTIYSSGLILWNERSNCRRLSQNAAHFCSPIISAITHTWE